MAASDSFGSAADSLEQPYRRAVAITPHASTELAEVTRAIVATDSGTAPLLFKDDTVEVTVTLVAGVVYPFRVRRVGTGGGAAGIVGLY